MRRKVFWFAVPLALVAAAGVAAVLAASSSTTLRGGDSLTVRCDGKKLGVTVVNGTTSTLKCVKSPTTAAASTPIPTATPTPRAATSPAGTVLGGCAMFPADNPWNQDVSGLPVHPNSQNYINRILANGTNDYLHADFGEDPSYGIPYVVVPATQAMVPVTFFDWPEQSDPGPYPVPLDAPIEAGGDAHVLVLRQGECRLYEMYNAERSGPGWAASNGAAWDLGSNALRPEGWTSADAAGLPILAGLVRYPEVAAGKITHALRFTVSRTQRAFIHPATHWASSSTNANDPPMGLRVRLKASYDISGYIGQARVILEALKRYGMIVADNGGDWFISGEQGAPWDDEDLDQLKRVPGSAFEVVDTGPVVTTVP